MSIVKNRAEFDGICAVAYAYCKEDPSLIENYDHAKADNFKGWVVHHRDEIRVLPSGMIALRSVEDLIADGRYFHCPANELIFMKYADHLKLHSANITDVHKSRISASCKGHATSDKVRNSMRSIGKANKGKHWRIVNGQRIWY